MNIMRDWQLEFDQAQFTQEHGQAYQRALRRPGMPEVFDATFREIADLLEPAVVWDVFPVQEMHHETFILANGRRIGNGPVTTVMGGASELAIAVCTVGPRVSAQIKRYQDRGEAIRSFLLDQLGTMAVAQLSQQFYRWLEEDVRSRGLHISTSLSPGESVWSIKDQAVIFDLLDTASIGVSLTPTMLMKPVKSVSQMVGMGSKPMGVPGTTHCDFCTMADRCQYRGQHPH